MSEIPWLWPGVAVAVVAGLILANRVARLLGTGRAVGWLAVVAVGAILSATLTPGREALESGTSGRGTCDFQRLGPAGPSDLLSTSEAGPNILLFIPLGAVIGLLPGGRRRAALTAAAVALPVVIEATQLVVVPFDRACESADVIDNLTGLGIGVLVGWLVGRSEPIRTRLGLASRPGQDGQR
ncbi:MAG TPA: VanZ family protein [Candidatus Limnocylindrales bacterium]|nr:VanZ family protein [Candidatus Limnocylindrales bacterium]